MASLDSIFLHGGDKPASHIHCTCDLWADLAVFVIDTAAKLMPPTPPSVAEAFVTVLVGFVGDWAAI